MKKVYLLTTPLYYANASPHLGTMYTTTLADIFHRYLKLNNINAFFITGTDEHGQKIEQVAKKTKKEINIFLDEMAATFFNEMEKLEINYDYFIRTTSNYHERYVIKKINNLLEKDYIYKGVYKGYYSIKDEDFLTPDEVVDRGEGLVSIKDNNPIEIINQEVYYLKVINHFPSLLKKLNEKDFLLPQEKVNELINMINSGNLDNLCISRNNSNMWGIHFPNDKAQCLYVWIDALFGYYSALEKIVGDLQQYNISSFHLIGKEIVKFHSLYLPILLKLSKTNVINYSVYSHQWILSGNKKMSKSVGNTISVNAILDLIGTEATRYYLFTRGPLIKDSFLSIKNSCEVYNTELVNKYSNLVYRVTTLIKKNNLSFQKINIDLFKDVDFEGLKEIRKIIFKIKSKTESDNLMFYFETLSFIRKKILDLIELENKMLSESEPWKLLKNKKTQEAIKILFISTLGIIFITFLLSSITPKKSYKVFRSFSFNYWQIKFIWNKDKNGNSFINNLMTLITTINSNNIKPIMVYKKVISS